MQPTLLSSLNLLKLQRRSENHLFRGWISIVFVTDVLHELVIWIWRERQRNCPGFGIRLRVVDRYSNLHMAEIFPVEPLRHVQCVGTRHTGAIDPILLVEPGRLDYKRISIPTTNRVAHIGGIGVPGKLTAVRENLAPGLNGFEKDHSDFEHGHIENFEGIRGQKRSWNAARETPRPRIIEAVGFPPLVVDRLRFGEHHNLPWLEILSDIVLIPIHSPDSRDVRLAVRSSRRRRREVGRTVRSSRNSWSFVVHPLCRGWQSEN